MKQKNTFIIFSNLKQRDIAVIIFILAKLIWMKLRQIKANYQKIWQNLMINLDQFQLPDGPYSM